MSVLSRAVRLWSPLLVLAASACTTPQSSLWSEAESRKEIQVRKIELDHDILFAAGSADLIETESRRLDDFLAQIGRAHV